MKDSFLMLKRPPSKFLFFEKRISKCRASTVEFSLPFKQLITKTKKDYNYRKIIFKMSKLKPIYNSPSLNPRHDATTRRFHDTSFSENMVTAAAITSRILCEPLPINHMQKLAVSMIGGLIMNRYVGSRGLYKLDTIDLFLYGLKGYFMIECAFYVYLTTKSMVSPEN